MTNLTAGGSYEQTMVLVDHGVIDPLCELLDINDPKVSVSLHLILFFFFF